MRGNFEDAPGAGTSNASDLSLERPGVASPGPFHLARLAVYQNGPTWKRQTPLSAKILEHAADVARASVNHDGGGLLLTHWGRSDARDEA